MANEKKKPVKIVETVLRDAHQSLIATRMTTEQMLPIIGKMDEVGYHAVECLSLIHILIDQLAAAREAGEDMKSTLDEQIDKFEDDNNFRNIDPEADKISFTSSKNPSPNSVQIVLRTDEISDDDESTDISDQEADGSSEEGPLKRMWRCV